MCSAVIDVQMITKRARNIFVCCAWCDNRKRATCVTCRKSILADVVLPRKFVLGGFLFWRMIMRDRWQSTNREKRTDYESLGYLGTVKVKGGTSFAGWHVALVAECIIMYEEFNLFGMTINYALTEIFVEIQWKAHSNVLETFAICLQL